MAGLMDNEEFDEPYGERVLLSGIPKERIPFKHKGHRYNIWENDAYGYPMLIAEFTAPDDRTARKMTPEIISARINEPIKNTKELMRLIRKDIALYNIDTMKKVPLHRPSIISNQWNKLRKLF